MVAAGGSGITPKQLPADLRAFVNRHTELSELDAVLPGADGEQPGASVAGAWSWSPAATAWQVWPYTTAPGG